MRRAGARINRKRQLVQQFLPILPAMQCSEIIGTDEPDEIDMRVGRFQRPHRINGVMRAEARLLSADDKTPVIGQRAHRGEALFKRIGFVGFERVLRAYQPPDIIDLQRPQRRFGDQAMTVMRRVETAAKQCHFGTREKLRRGGFGHRLIWAASGHLFGPRLAGAAHGIFEAGQLLQPDRPARVKATRRNADLGPHAELTAIGKLRRGIVHDNGAVDAI